MIFILWIDGSTFYAEIGIIRDKSIYKPDESLMGISRMLSELKYCYNMVNEDMNFKKYKVLILPDKVV